MVTTLSVTEVARNFADCVNRVAYRGERIVVVRGKRAVAELHPVPQGRRLGDLPQILRALPRLGEKEAASFARDVATARKKLNRGKVRDPWAI